MRLLRALTVAPAVALLAAAPAAALTVTGPHHPRVREPLRIRLVAASPPADGGYYYGVVVLRPYRGYTRRSPPPCSTSSDMQRTDYAHPSSGMATPLALTPAASRTHHWCPGGRYEGAVYAVPHAPPCEGRYPCAAEPYSPPSPCWGPEGHVVCGLVAEPVLWAYPDRLPAPLASGTTLVARFAVTFTR